MEFTTIPIIVMICAVFMSVIKLFTKDSEKEEEIISTIVPVFGAIFTLILYFINSDYTMEFHDPLVAFMIGFVSGQASLETKSTIDYLKSKKELKKLIVEQVVEPEVIEEVKNEVINEIVNNEEIQNILKENQT